MQDCTDSIVGVDPAVTANMSEVTFFVTNFVLHFGSLMYVDISWSVRCQ